MVSACAYFEGRNAFTALLIRLRSNPYARRLVKKCAILVHDVRWMVMMCLFFIQCLLKE
jgi:hypothetical protein